MTRSKQEMKLIVGLKKRRTTYRNRWDGLVQKASQLATLCDIDVFLVCFPSAAGGAEVTVWPSDGRVVEDLVARFRALPATNIKQVLDTRALLQEGLAKEQRRLYKVRQYGADDVLTAWDSSLDHLTVDGLKDLHGALDEALQRTRAQIDALRRGSAVDEVVPSAVTAPATRDIVFAPAAVAAPAQHAPAVLFGFPLNSSGAGTGGSQYHYNPCRFLPQPPPLVDQMVQMPPPRLSIQMPPPPLAAPSDMASAGFMENLPYTTNVLNGGGLYGDLGQVFSGGAG